MPQNAMSDQGLHCLLKLQKVQGNETVLSPHLGPFSQPTLRDSRLTSTICALIFSTPEQKLKVSYCDHPLSVLRSPSSIVRCQQLVC